MPSWDWKDITDFHSNDAKYRAIEGGFNIMKNTVNGITTSFDAKGRVLYYRRARDYDDYFMVVTINKKGIKTFYSYVGFLFNYLYIIILLCILLFEPIYQKFLSKKRVSSYKIEELNYTSSEKN